MDGQTTAAIIGSSSTPLPPPMGHCMSSGAASARAGAAPPTKDTALVLMPSGEMREYPRPTIAARVLEDAAASTSSPEDDWFLCDADGVGFEGPVPVARDVEQLRAGQIYFVLPVSARRRGLCREEVAALAVRASAALSSRAASASAATASGKRRRGAVVVPLVFAPPPSEEDERFAAACKAACKAPPVRRLLQSGKRLERFASDLTAIAE